MIGLRVNQFLNVLISTPSPDEKDTVFGPMVHKKIAYKILKMEVFLVHPLLNNKGNNTVLASQVDTIWLNTVISPNPHFLAS